MRYLKLTDALKQKGGWVCGDRKLFVETVSTGNAKKLFGDLAHNILSTMYLNTLRKD